MELKERNDRADRQEEFKQKKAEAQKALEELEKAKIRYGDPEADQDKEKANVDDGK